METSKLEKHKISPYSNPKHAAGDSLKSFLFAIRSKQTEKRYIIQLGYFFDFLKIEGENLEQRASTWLSLLLLNEKGNEKGSKWANDCLIDYITYLKERVDNGEITGGTLGNYYGVVKSFYESQEIELNWKRIEKGLPESGAVANDRAPSLEEIRKICEYPDRRIKVLVYVMVSSGIRVGAWEHLRLKHITPIYSPQNDKVVIAAKLSVYEGRPKPYICFVTPEAYQAIQDYVDFRKMHGEKITPESWVLRDKFETTSEPQKPGAKMGLVTAPKKLQTNGIKKILIRAMRSQGIRQSLEKGVKRYEFKLAHGYRKYFFTNASRVMLSDNVAKLADHKIPGMRPHYVRFTEQELLDDYLRAVDHLTINRDQKVANQLQKQVIELTERNEQANYTIQGKLAEKEKEMEEMRAREEQTTKRLEEIAESMHKFKLQMMDDLRKREEEEKDAIAAYDDPKRVANMIANLQLMQKFKKENPGEPFPWAEIEEQMKKDNNNKYNASAKNKSIRF